MEGIQIDCGRLIVDSLIGRNSPKATGSSSETCHSHHLTQKLNHEEEIKERLRRPGIHRIAAKPHL